MPFDVEDTVSRDIVLVVGDSLSRPRDNLPYEHTWVHKLSEKSQEWDIVNVSDQGATTESLLQKNWLEHYRPDVVVTQLGIVDCAPRYLNAHERKLLILPDWFSDRFRELMRRLRKRSPKRSYVDLQTFRDNLTHFYRDAKTRDIPVVSMIIAPPTDEFVRKSPLITEAVRTYNEAYEDVASGFPNVTIANPYEGISSVDDYMLDEHHPNERGHKLMYEAVAEQLGYE